MIPAARVMEPRWPSPLRLSPVGGRQVLDQAEFWLGLVYVSFPFGLLICQPFAFKGRLPARLRARELAEPRVTGALVYVPFRCHVCDALPSVRRTYGLGTRSTRWPPDTRRCPRSTTGQVAVGRAPAIRGSPPSSRQALPGSRWTSCSCGVIALTHQGRCGSCFSRGPPWHSGPCPGCGSRLRWRQGSHPLKRRGTCLQCVRVYSRSCSPLSRLACHCTGNARRMF